MGSSSSVDESAGQGTAALAPETPRSAGPLNPICCGGIHHVSARQFEELIAAIDRRDAEAAAEMPDDAAALKVMFRAFERLKKLGWREAIYCPKDGSTFQVIEPGSTGIHEAHYEGTWPKGGWWVHEAGDLWPSHPILWRPIPATSELDDREAVVPRDATPPGMKNNVLKALPKNEKNDG